VSADPRQVLDAIPWEARTLNRLVRSRSARDPGQLAVEVAGTALTWRELDERSAALAAGLAAVGVRRGDVVHQIAGNTPGHVVRIFALARLGAVECPVNVGLRGESLRHVLTHAQAKVMIVEPDHLDRVGDALPAGQGAELVVVPGGTGILPGRRVVAEEDLPLGPVADADVKPSDPATLLYTSGTTGPAKGVVHAHHFAFATAAIKIGVWGLGPDDVLFSPLPLFHANARYSTLLTACVLGARAVIVERFSATRFWEQVRAAGATEVGTVGTVAPILLERPEGPEDRDHRVRMLHGAGALSPERRAEFERRFGIRVVTGFSMTETSHVATTGPDDPGRYRGAGRPVPGFRIAIVDDADRPLPPGEVGEIAIRPELPYAMMLGYHRDEPATLAAFRNLWFHTGDLGRLDDDGYLHWTDRRKDAIRRRGEMISSADVEAAAEEHSAVAAAAAVAVPGDLGEEEVLLVMTARDGSEIDLQALLAHCRLSLPDFAVPRYYRVVADLPRNATHKVDKAELRRQGLAVGTWDAAAPTGD
jgi:crotonobetaine/carnitine-CoA ligase